jgi:hypothetical protein
MTQEQIKNEDLFIWKDGQAMINGSIAFEFVTTYGFPLELFEETVNSLLPAGSKARAYHIAKAYDNFHGTSFRDLIKF